MPNSVPQKMLKRYLEAQAAEKSARSRREHLRAQLIGLVEAGATVEAGKYTLTVDKQHRQTLRWAELRSCWTRT